MNKKPLNNSKPEESLIFNNNFKNYNKVMVKNLWIRAFFEYNPRNPITHALDNKGPLNENADLIRLGYITDLLTDHGLKVLKSRYCFYFPEIMKYLDRFENYLSWIPLGGKYHVLAFKNQ